MILRGPGVSFELELLGYQFRQVRGDFYDDNWLSVRIAVAHPKGTWTVVDPSLQTTEVAALAEWLTAIAEGRAIDRELSFIEPNLSFCLNQEEPGGKQLRVYFEQEYRPSWAAFEQDLWIQLPAEPMELHEGAASLRAALEKYPFRGEAE